MIDFQKGTGYRSSFESIREIYLGSKAGTSLDLIFGKALWVRSGEDKQRKTHPKNFALFNDLAAKRTPSEQKNFTGLRQLEQQKKKRQSQPSLLLQNHFLQPGTRRGAGRGGEGKTRRRSGSPC